MTKRILSGSETVKNKVRLSESSLLRIIKESVKKVLKEKSEYLNDINGLDVEDYTDDGDITDWADKDWEDYSYEEYDNLQHKFKGGDTLEKLIHNHPNFKKWYERMHKRAQNKASWDAFDNYHKKRLADYKNFMRKRDF